MLIPYGDGGYKPRSAALVGAARGPRRCIEVCGLTATDLVGKVKEWMK